MILQFLETWVRKPMAGSALDVHVFLPAKTAYLSHAQSQAREERVISGKND
jgi:hypothetical protein